MPLRMLMHQTVLQPKFVPQSQRRKREGENCSPFTYSHRGTYKCEQKPGVDGVTNPGVGSADDELVTFLDGHRTAPI